MFSKKAISGTKIQGIFLSSDKVSIHLCIHHSFRMLQGRLFYAELGNAPSSVQLSTQFQWPGNLIRLLNAISLHLQHAKRGSASLRRCSVRGTHSRVSALLTTQSGGFKLLESINNANKLCHPGSQPRGIILLGDSAGAHFRISPEWITASQMALVSSLGSYHPRCAGPPCLSPLALSKCDASSKQVQISLLSKICHKRRIHSRFGSAHFQQRERKCGSIATTGSPREPRHPLESGGRAGGGGHPCEWEGDFGPMGKTSSCSHLRGWFPHPSPRKLRL